MSLCHAGFYTGCSVALIAALCAIVHVDGDYNDNARLTYLHTIFPSFRCISSSKSWLSMKSKQVTRSSVLLWSLFAMFTLLWYFTICLESRHLGYKEMWTFQVHYEWKWLKLALVPQCLLIFNIRWRGICFIVWRRFGNVPLLQAVCWHLLFFTCTSMAGISSYGGVFASIMHSSLSFLLAQSWGTEKFF